MKCLVVDDDPLTCDTVESFLQRVGGVDYCLKVNDGPTALHLLAAESFDAVFLDLELPGMDGVSILGALPGDAPVVIISANPGFGADSYGFGVVDYLVKPIEFSRFAKAVVKLKMGRRPPRETEDRAEAIFLRDGSTIQRIDLSKLAFIEAQSNYSLFVFYDGTSVMSLISLRRLEEMLPAKFIRIHRSFIVNCACILNIEGSKLTLPAKTLPVGQSYRENLLEKLKVIN